MSRIRSSATATSSSSTQRGVVGPRITEAWNTEPVAEDGEIHNPGWDFSGLDASEDAYLRAVADHLGWLYAPLRRKLRRRR